MQPNNQYQQQPQQNQNYTPLGIDYLNQIAAPPPPQKNMSDKKKIILIIFGVIGIISLGMILFNLTKPNDTPLPLKIYTKIQQLQEVSSDYHKKIRSSALQTHNSSLTAVLTTANKSITTPLASYKDINLKKVRPSEKQAKEIADLREELDDAYLNFRLEEVYIREMSYQIEETIINMKSLRKVTNYRSMREYLDKTVPDLEALQERFESLGPNDETPQE